MKKLIATILSIVMSISLVACGGTSAGANESSQNNLLQNNNVEIKTSPDKYTWYMKNYVGKNLAGVGYTSLSGDRMDSYGGGYIELILLTPNGEYIDISNEEELKGWRVVAQSLEPNTEIKYVFECNDEGEEYDHLVFHQNVEEIVLAVAPVGKAPAIPSLTAINLSPDRYTSYIADYVGRTLAQCGYISLAGKLMDQYGKAYVYLAVYSDDGSYIDVQDENTLKNYMVTSQSLAPNTEIKMEYMLDSKGNEYDNLIDNQNIEEIELYVVKVNDYTS